MSRQSEPERRDLAGAEIERDVHDMFERLFVVPNGRRSGPRRALRVPAGREDDRVGFLPDGDVRGGRWAT